jgi:hypothetical protein
MVTVYLYMFDVYLAIRATGKISEELPMQNLQKRAILADIGGCRTSGLLCRDSRKVQNLGDSLGNK